MTIKDLSPGEGGRIVAVGGEGALRQHFLDMGVIPGAELTVVKLAPMVTADTGFAIIPYRITAARVAEMFRSAYSA